MTASIRLLLVDDHTILRQGLKQLLELETGFAVVAEAGDGQEAVVQALSQKPDVVMMDINLPKLNGYEASRSILMAWPEARILVLTNQDDAPVLRKFLDLGVKGFLLKDVPIEVLAESIRKVARGETVRLTPELEAKLGEFKSIDSLVEPLTEREQEVLKGLSKGYSNQQLADLLVVSPKTVHNHLYNIYQKIGVGSRAEAIVWAIESGFLGK